MPSAPLTISLITPSRDCADYLGQAMASVLDQRYPSLEYIVVDANSKDATPDILETFKGRFTLISGQDAGMYDALNKGFSASSGEIMGWLNADDMQFPWTLSVVAEIFEAHPEIEWITSLFPATWDRRGRLVKCATRRGFSKPAFFRGWNLPAPERPYAHWIQQESTFWRRSLWDRCGGHISQSHGAAGDFELWARFFTKASLFGVATLLGAFRRHEGQLSQGPGYAEQAQGALELHGGKPAGWLRHQLDAAGWILLPNRLRRICSSVGITAESPIVAFDHARRRWAIDRR